MHIALCSIFVEDPIKAFKFYTEVLGFKEKMFMPDMKLAIVTAPDQSDGTAIILEPDQNLGARKFREGVYNAGLPWFVCGTKDIQKEYEELKKKGVKFRSEPKKEPYGIVAVFDDMQGNLVQLHQTN